jgi:hypothetical protein
MRSQGPAWNRAVVFGAMLWTLAAAATDVAFWEE